MVGQQHPCGRQGPFASTKNPTEAGRLELVLALSLAPKPPATPPRPVPLEQPAR